MLTPISTAMRRYMLSRSPCRAASISAVTRSASAYQSSAFATVGRFDAARATSDIPIVSIDPLTADHRIGAPTMTDETSTSTYADRWGLGFGKPDSDRRAALVDPERANRIDTG